MEQIRGTTILAVKRDGKTVVIGDGQATVSEHVVIKAHSHKVKRLYNGKVIVGFAGGTADAFTMFEEFEKMLNKYSGSLLRSTVELAREIRKGSLGRNMEALLIIADKDNLLMLTSVGDVLEPEDGVCAIGSGGNFALSAAKALINNTDLDATEIAYKAMDIASDLCVYTNKNFVKEEV